MQLPFATAPPAWRARADAFFARLQAADVIRIGAAFEANKNDKEDFISALAARQFFARAGRNVAVHGADLDRLGTEFGGRRFSLGLDANSNGATLGELSRPQFRLCLLLAQALARPPRLQAIMENSRRMSLLARFDISATLAENAKRGAFPRSLSESLCEAPDSFDDFVGADEDAESLMSLSSDEKRGVPHEHHEQKGAKHRGKSGSKPTSFRAGASERRSVGPIGSDGKSNLQGASTAAAAAGGGSAFVGAESRTRDVAPLRAPALPSKHASAHRRKRSIVTEMQEEKYAVLNESLKSSAEQNDREHWRGQRLSCPSESEHVNLATSTTEESTAGGSLKPVRRNVPSVVQDGTGNIKDLDGQSAGSHRDEAPVRLVPFKLGSGSPESKLEKVNVRLPKMGADAALARHTPPVRAQSLTTGQQHERSKTVSKSSGANYDVDLRDILSAPTEPPNTAAGLGDLFAKSGAARAESAALMSAAISFLERGWVDDSLARSKSAGKALRPYAHLYERELAVCDAYAELGTLLVEIRLLDEAHNAMPPRSTAALRLRVFAACLARFASAIILLRPRHRLVCIRMAIARNFELSNYGVAAKHIRLLLPLKVLDVKTLEAKLQLCAAGNFADKQLPQYKCRECESTVSCAAENCSICHSLIVYTPVLEAARGVREELQHSDSSIKEASTGLVSDDQKSDLQSFESERSRLDSLVAPADFSAPVRSYSSSSSSTSSSNVAGSVTTAEPSKRGKRDEVAFEILESERSYVAALDVLVNMYLHPLQEAVEFGPAGNVDLLISPDEIRSIFSDIEVIHSYNSYFLARLEQRMSNYEFDDPKTQVLSDIFLDFSPYLKTYTVYVNNTGLAFVTVNDMMRVSTEFSRLCLDNKRKCKGLDLNSFLIQPVQRVPRYVLLLRDLIKRTPTTHPDYSGLVEAHAKMADVAKYINDHKREADNMHLVYAMQEKVVGLKEPLLQPHRRFLRRGPIRELQSLRHARTAVGRYLLLFNDVLLVCKPVTQFRQSTAEVSSLDDRISDDETVYRVKRSLSLTSVYVGEWGDIAGLRLSVGSADRCLQITVSSRQSLHASASAPGRIVGHQRTPSSESSHLAVDSSDLLKGRYVFMCATADEAREWVSAISLAVARLTQMLTQRDEFLPKDLPPQTEDRISEYEWQLLMTNAVRQFLQKGDTVMRQYKKESDNHQPMLGSGKLFKVESGHVIAKIEIGSSTVFEEKLGPGSIFGHSAFVGRYKTNRTVSAGSKECIISVIEAGFVIRLLRVEPVISSKFYRHVAVHFASLLRATKNSENISYVFAPQDLSKSVVDRTSKFFKLFPSTFTEDLTRRAAVAETEAAEPPSLIVHKHFECGYTRNLTFRGDLFVMQDALCFYGHLFGMKKRKVILFSSVESIKKQYPVSAQPDGTSNLAAASPEKGDRNDPDELGVAHRSRELVLELTSAGKYPRKTLILSFLDASECDSAFMAIGNLLKIVQMRSSTSTGLTERRERSIRAIDPSSLAPSAPRLLRTSHGTPAEVPSAIAANTGNDAFGSIDGDDDDELTKDDWALILRNAEEMSLAGNKVVYAEGTGQQRIYQIITGSCRTERDVDGERVTVATLKAGDVFGEETFLLGGRAIMSVVTNPLNNDSSASPAVILYSVDARSIQLLFDVKPGLAGRFYRYLAVVLERRVRRRFKLQAERTAQRQGN